MADRTIETTAVFERTIVEYDLTVRHGGGQGQINVQVDGSTLDVLSSMYEQFSGQYEQGTQITLYTLPDSGWKVEGSPDTEFLLDSDVFKRITFVESTNGGGGDTGNPYNIPDKYWNDSYFIKVKDFLRDPAANDNGTYGDILLHFEGQFSDGRLKRGNKSAEQYAKEIADLIKTDAQVHNSLDTCLVEVYWTGFWRSGIGIYTYDHLKGVIQDW